jgi:hypothetical protein
VAAESDDLCHQNCTTECHRSTDAECVRGCRRCRPHRKHNTKTFDHTKDKRTHVYKPPFMMTLETLKRVVVNSDRDPHVVSNGTEERKGGYIHESVNYDIHTINVTRTSTTWPWSRQWVGPCEKVVVQSSNNRQTRQEEKIQTFLLSFQEPLGIC